MTRAALLFDLDGTLVDNDHLHHAAFAGILAERGVTLSFDDFRTHIVGQPNPAIMAHFFPGEDAAHQAIADRKEAMFRASLGQSVAPVAGIHDLLDLAATTGLGTAVVTNAPRANAVAMLAAAGLDRRLPLLVIGEECSAPKPDPAPYLAAMAALGADPEHSVAFEDSRAGLAAARASGAYVYGVATSLDPDDLLQAGAHRAITDFTDPALKAHLTELKDRVA